MNPYQQAIDNANKATLIKRTQKSFWEHPNMIIEDADSYESRGALLREASRALRSLPPSTKPKVQTVELHGRMPSDIEQHVWMGILRDTLSRFDAGQMTHRQLQVLAVLEEARHEGYLQGSPEEYRFVAKKLSIRDHSAYKLIRRIREKMGESVPKHDIMAVREVIFQLPRVCCHPTCETLTPRGDKPFCMAHFGYLQRVDSFVQEWIDASTREQTYRAREVLKAS